MKEARFFRQERANIDNKYPFERADRFNRDIRKLGVERNLTVLDRFRLLLTEIGNAMGYVRMVRAGAPQPLEHAPAQRASAPHARRSTASSCGQAGSTSASRRRCTSPTCRRCPRSPWKKSGGAGQPRAAARFEGGVQNV